MIFIIIIGVIATGIILITTIFKGETLSKDEILNTYDDFMEVFSEKGISKDKELEGKRKFGIDEYEGNYKASYENATKEEVLFGGTTLNRENGNKIKLKLKVEKQSGDVAVIANLGTTEKILISDTGECEKDIDIEGKSYYLNLKLDHFTGKVEIIAE